MKSRTLLTLGVLLGAVCMSGCASKLKTAEPREAPAPEVRKSGETNTQNREGYVVDQAVEEDESAESSY